MRKEMFSWGHKLITSFVLVTMFFCACLMSSTIRAQTIEFNSAGGTSTTNGLHFYIDRSSKIQVRRLNNTGQVYSPTALPQTNPNSLDNGVFLRGNNLVYGPSHTVTAFNPTGGMYSTYSITAATPANPSAPGVLQTATSNLGVSNGPQITILWKYTTPNDFLTAEVTLVIPSTYPIGVNNPVRYYHVFDTYLGGSDNGCGLNIIGTNRIVGTYSAPCGSSSSLPASGVVESFRERGRPFSAYCAAGWSTFFATGGSTICSVLQTNPLNNTITTTLQDTGIGIEFDFTATGTYTFSYDFVVGSTAVPDYDHLEIRHDGSATLCPENMIVLACTTPGVPCDPGDLVNSGTLTGSILFSPAATGTSFSPSNFSLGVGATTANLSLQATSASAGTYTMYASGLSKIPLNGTKCANLDGSAATSCSITITNTACASKFECMETGLTYNNPVTVTNRNPLYTQVAGQGFKFDVLALQASGAIVNSYAGSVDVELIDDASNTCVGPTAIATQSLTFVNGVGGDNGRKTLTADFTVSGAYKKLTCRVKEKFGSSPVTACSSDRFTVRPQSFSSISSNADADPSGLSASNTQTGGATPAGNDFTLIANTNTPGYDGLPKIDASYLQWPNVPSVVNGGRAAPGTGNLSGTFSTPADSTNGNGASGSTFKYDEVGYFRIRAQGLYDDTFVSSAAAADSTANNIDCIVGSTSNVKDISSDPLKRGRYGCNFANVVDTVHVGRFIPHHFNISAASTTEACAVFVPFTYFGQDGALTSFTLTAKNSSDNKTQNYTSTYAKFNPLVYVNYGFNLTGAPVGTTLSSSATAPTGSWLAGEANVSAKHQISRPTTLANETIITINSAPSDGEVSTPPATPLLVSTTRQRYGRMKLQSAYGSEMLDLPVPFIAEYRNGDQWLKNVDDSCYAIVAPGAGTGVTFYDETASNHLTTGETTASVSASGKLVAGDSKLKFSKPGVGNSGYLDLNIPVSAWLQFPWRGGATAIDPTAKVKFGTYKKSNQFIYTREVH